MGTSAPDELRVARDRRSLTVAWGERSHVISAELLRVESPSAEVQGHDPSQKKLVAGKRDVAIAAIQPTGNYAVRIAFDDGHDSGIYTWAALERFGRESEAMMANYEAALRAAGRER